MNHGCEAKWDQFRDGQHKSTSKGVAKVNGNTLSIGQTNKRVASVSVPKTKEITGDTNVPVKKIYKLETSKLSIQ